MEEFEATLAICHFLAVVFEEPIPQEFFQENLRRIEAALYLADSRLARWKETDDFLHGKKRIEILRLQKSKLEVAQKYIKSCLAPERPPQ